jgi:hypothetical protein
MLSRTAALLLPKLSSGDPARRRNKGRLLGKRKLSRNLLFFIYYPN